LKAHTDQKDDDSFVRRGFPNARAFYAQYVRLGGLFVVNEVSASRSVIKWENPEARHALPREAVTALLCALRDS
jgi:hypothetical protein